MKDRARIIPSLLRHGKADVHAALATCRGEGVDADRPVLLSTIHGSKSLEWGEVWWLDAHLCHTGHEKEDHLRYVAVTRARDRLVYFESEGWGQDEVFPSLGSGSRA